MEDQHLGIIEYLNDSLGAQLDPACFGYEVLWNRDGARLDLMLRSLAAQELVFSGSTVNQRLEDGETIHTGYVYLYDEAAVVSVSEKAGLTVADSWLDPDGDYGLFVLVRN